MKRQFCLPMTYFQKEEALRSQSDEVAIPAFRFRASGVVQRREPSCQVRNIYNEYLVI